MICFMREPTMVLHSWIFCLASFRELRTACMASQSMSFNIVCAASQLSNVFAAAKTAAHEVCKAFILSSKPLIALVAAFSAAAQVVMNSSLPSPMSCELASLSSS